ncbi:MAG: ACT domain-containing protein [bacterium]|nr:ACT domain-containing protein [bacterium]
MGIQQISVFAENKPGKLEKITRILAENNINILAISIASSDAFGVLKFVVDDTKKALKALQNKGMTVSLEEVLAIEMVDKPGGLHQIAEFFSRNKLNIENAHVLVLDTRKRAYLLVEGVDVQLAKKLLKKANIPFYQGKLTSGRKKK